MARGEASGSGKLIMWGVVLFAGYELVTKVIKPNVIVPLRMKQQVMKLRLGKIYGVKLKNDAIEFLFPIENPNNEPMTVKAIVGDVLVQGPKGRIKLGAVNHFGTDVIKPVGETNFDLVVKLNLVNEFLLLSQVFNKGMKGYTVTFNGTVNANNRTWPVNEIVYKT